MPVQHRIPSFCEAALRQPGECMEPVVPAIALSGEKNSLRLKVVALTPPLEDAGDSREVRGLIIPRIGKGG